MNSFSLPDLAASIVLCAAIFGYVNHRYIGLRQTTGLTLMGAAASLVVVAVDTYFPSVQVGHQLRETLEGIDFRFALMEGLLSFLLFAGALHIDLSELRRTKWAVAAITLSGVLVSTAIIGGCAWAVGEAFGLNLSLVWCLLFGALISPTDPVAVMGILKTANVPPPLEAAVAGESLFNDGVGVVVFAILLGAATGGGEASLVDAARLFAVEVLGGVALGLAAGWIAFSAMRRIDEHNLEVLITLALVMGGYMLAHHLHVNGPIAMAVAGLIIGNHGRQLAMSDKTRDYVTKFWSLIDELLNAVLFLLIGLEVIVVLDDYPPFLLGLFAIPLTLLARAISVGLPMLATRRLGGLPPGSYSILVLGGVRGGISIALALAVPEGPQKQLIVVATYLVVLFSVLVQSYGVGLLARRLFRSPNNPTG